MLANGFHDVPAGKLATISTQLEMRSAAPLRGAELPDGLSFRKMVPELDWYRDVFKRVGSMDWLWYGRLRLSDSDLLAIIADPAVDIYTLDRHGVSEALLELDFREKDACELVYFGLTSRLVGTGCGGYLMDQAISLAWAKPIERFHVRTCTMDSPQALGFYQRSGFTPVRQQVEIDDDPRISGLLPKTAAAPRVPLIKP